jgi:hypothetical protein
LRGEVGLHARVAGRIPIGWAGAASQQEAVRLLGIKHLDGYTRRHCTKTSATLSAAQSAPTRTLAAAASLEPPGSEGCLVHRHLCFCLRSPDGLLHLLIVLL